MRSHVCGGSRLNKACGGSVTSFLDVFACVDTLSYLCNSIPRFSDVAVLLSACRVLRRETEPVCRSWALHTWGYEFWRVAAARDPRISKPCETWYEELKRIEVFNQLLESNGLQRWGKRDFFRFWASLSAMSAH